MESLKELKGDEAIGYLPKEQWAVKNIHDRGLKSLQGLQYAKNLEALDLSDNEIKDLTPLKDLKKLTYIELDRNMLSNLTPLSNLTNLVHLNIYNNENIVDTTPISNLTNLKWIDMHFCNRGKASVNVQPLGKLINLEYLSIESNFIEDISFVNNLKKLKSFSCAVNHVTDLTPVENLSVTAYDNWDDDIFLNMYGQIVKNPIKINVDAKEQVVNIPVPVKGLEKYINKYKDILEGEVPNVSLKNGEDDDFISVKCNKEKNQVDVMIKSNESNSPRELHRDVFLDYGMYTLIIKVDINQKAATK